MFEDYFFISRNSQIHYAVFMRPDERNCPAGALTRVSLPARIPGLEDGDGSKILGHNEAIISDFFYPAGHSIDESTFFFGKSMVSSRKYHTLVVFRFNVFVKYTNNVFCRSVQILIVFRDDDEQRLCYALEHSHLWILFAVIKHLLGRTFFI